MWGSDAALSGLPPDDSRVVDDGPAPPPTSPILVLNGHSAMNALCWTKHHVIVAMATCVCEMFPPIGGCYMGGTYKRVLHEGAPWNSLVSKIVDMQTKHKLCP